MSPTRWREEFWVPDDGPYLLSHSVGCLLRDAAARLEADYLGPWKTRGGDAWPHWLAAIEEFRHALAALLGGSAAHYCPQSNVSSGLAKLLTALPAPSRTRNAVLVSEQCFPSIAFVLMHAPGYSVRFLPESDSPAQLEAQLDAWRKALGGAGDVCAALITHVHSTTGVAAPVAQIAAECRARGVLSIIDIAQSAGIVPLDVAAAGADCVLGSCVKWLCGGPGAGFMWLRAGLIGKLQPTDVGWFSHADPFEFDPHHFEYAPDARRFWGGTPSVAPFILAAATIRRLTQIGTERIREHNLELQHRLARSIEPAWELLVSDTARGGTACLSLGDRRERVEHALRARGVRFDTRGEILRISFHIYNDEDDVGTVAEALKAGAV